MKILYGVPGEGMGHATRSKVVIQYLLEKGHEVRVVSSAKAFQFLNQQFPERVHEIKGFHFAYKDAAISKFKTFTEILKNSPKNLLTNFDRYREIHQVFQPDLVISDFESFSYFLAKFHRLPIISIDNMQVIDRCALEIKIPKAERDNFRLARNIVRSKLPQCDQYWITSFFDAPVRKKRTQLIPPILREAILEAKPKVVPGDHILIYQSSTPEKKLLKYLKVLPEVSFKVYGFNKEAQQGNVQLRAFSEAGFIHDLATAKAVLANGGFSFLSEAVYLQKPVLAVPIENQFEQFVNARYIDRCGYGRHFASFRPDGIKAFLYDLDRFATQLQGYQQEGNAVLFQMLDTIGV